MQQYLALIGPWHVVINFLLIFLRFGEKGGGAFCQGQCNAKHYNDNSISAKRRGVKRVGFERQLNNLVDTYF